MLGSIFNIGARSIGVIACVVAVALPGRSLAGSSLLATNDPPQVSFIAMPRDLQLYPRDEGTNLASISIAGMVLDPGYDSVRLRAYRNGLPYGPEYLMSLEYVNGVAAFCVRTSIVAELAMYDFDLFIDQGTNEIMIASAGNVVAGDVFIHNGQSNAQSTQRGGQPSINDPVPHTNNWIRSFGSRDDDAVIIAGDTDWHIAAGDHSWGSGEIGQWALRAANLLVEEQGIPVAVISQANGGVGISFFQRNDAFPEDLTTDYGRLLWRCRQAGVAEKINAILWYQGEFDALGSPSTYEASMDTLHAAWLEDYPAVERVYIHQLKIGCGTVSQNDVGFRDMQRLWANANANVCVMSTTAVTQNSDACHTDTAANLELGLNLQRVMSVELYGAPAQNNIYAPEIDVAYFSTASSNEIVLRNRWTGDHLNVESGAVNDFQLHGVSAPVLVNVVADGNVLRLQLSWQGSGANAVSYKANADWPTPGPDITNDGGVGLLAFFAIQIGPYVPPSPDGDEDQDGLPNQWEDEHFGNVYAADPEADVDGDGVRNLDEFLAGTDPNNSTSVLCVTAYSVIQGDVLSFASSTQRTYTVQFSSNLNGEIWIDVASGIRGQAETTVVTNLASTSRQGFYRLLVEQ